MINNLAVAHLYTGRLRQVRLITVRMLITGGVLCEPLLLPVPSLTPQAIAVLEEALRRDPLAGLQEALVFNLSTLYELESEGAIEKKKTVMVQAAKHYGDHFNIDNLKSV